MHLDWPAGDHWSSSGGLNIDASEHCLSVPCFFFPTWWKISQSQEDFKNLHLQESWVMAILMLFFILFGSLTVMNMLLGVLVEAWLSTWPQRLKFGCTAWTGDQDCVYHRTGTIGSGLCQEVFVGNDWQRPWARLCERVKKISPFYTCTEFLLKHRLWHIMTTPSTQDLKSFMCHRTCRSGWWQPNLWGRVSQCFKDSPGISVIPWHWRRSKHIEIYSSIGWGDSDEVEHDDNSPKAMAALTSLGVDVEAALDYGLLSCG